MSANQTQVSGTHYKDKAIQPWDYIVSNNLGYLEGNIIKYISRWKDKGGVADLKKAQHYLQKLIEVSEPAATMADVAEVKGNQVQSLFDESGKHFPIIIDALGGHFAEMSREDKAVFMWETGPDAPEIISKSELADRFFYSRFVEAHPFRWQRLPKGYNQASTTK